MRPNAKKSVLAVVLPLILMTGSINFACIAQPTPPPKPTPAPPSSPAPAPPSSPAPSPQTQPPSSPTPSPATPPALTKVQFLGHACFLITSNNGVRIITDPYATNERFNYLQVNETADVVTVSHEHSDHNNVAAVGGQPEVLRGVGVKNVKGIEFRGIASYHDDSGGKQRGANTIFCFSVDGIKFCHLGDLGHQLGVEQVAEIGQIDVLLIPVGGVFTIDAGAATVVSNILKPKIAIPMHYKTPKITLALAGVEEFLKEKTNTKRLSGSTLELRSVSLPAAPEIIVFETAK